MAGGRGERRGPGRLPVRARRPGGQLGDWFWNASLRRPAPRPRRAGWSLASEQQVPGGDLTVRVGPAEETWEATESGETQRGVVQTGEPGPKDEPYDTPKLRERGREEEMGGRREEGSHGLSQIPRWPGPGREALTAALAPELGGDAGGQASFPPGGGFACTGATAPGDCGRRHLFRGPSLQADAETWGRAWGEEPG